MCVGTPVPTVTPRRCVSWPSSWCGGPASCLWTSSGTPPSPSWPRRTTSCGAEACRTTPPSSSQGSSHPSQEQQGQVRVTSIFTTDIAYILLHTYIHAVGTLYTYTNSFAHTCIHTYRYTVIVAYNISLYICIHVRLRSHTQRSRLESYLSIDPQLCMYVSMNMYMYVCTVVPICEVCMYGTHFHFLFSPMRSILYLTLTLTLVSLN